MDGINSSLNSLLRATPALLSAAAVTMTLCEDVFFRPFGRPQAALRPQANRLLSAHVVAFASRGMSMTAIFYFGGIGAGAANLRWRGGGDGGLVLSSPSSPPQDDGLAPMFYLAGTVFNAMHFAFAPRDLALMDVITDESNVDAGKGKDNCTAMTNWVRMNVTRGLVADLPAFICNLFGLVLSLS